MLEIFHKGDLENCTRRRSTSLLQEARQITTNTTFHFSSHSILGRYHVCGEVSRTSFRFIDTALHQGQRLNSYTLHTLAVHTDAVVGHPSKLRVNVPVHGACLYEGASVTLCEAIRNTRVKFAIPMLLRAGLSNKLLCCAPVTRRLLRQSPRPASAQQYCFIATEESATQYLSSLLALDLRTGDCYCLTGKVGSGKSAFR